MYKLINKSALMRGFALGLVTVASASLMSGAASAQNLKIMAGQSGGTWDGLAGALKTIVEAGVPGSTLDIRPGGAVANVKAVGIGQADLAWMSATTTVQGLKGEGSFDEPIKVCNVAVFHPTVIQMVTSNPEVQNLSDLRGKRVGALPVGTGSEALARQMMEFNGVSEQDLAQYNHGSFPDGATMLKDGHIDAFLSAAGIPSGGYADMFASVSGLRMLPVTDEDFQKLKDSNAAYVRYTIKADTYPNMPNDVLVAAYPTHLGIGCNVDEQIAYQITKSVIDNYKDLGSVVTEISRLESEDLVTDIGVPLHPGAERAYKEAGIL